MHGREEDLLVESITREEKKEPADKDAEDEKALR